MVDTSAAPEPEAAETPPAEQDTAPQEGAEAPDEYERGLGRQMLVETGEIEAKEEKPEETEETTEDPPEAAATAAEGEETAATPDEETGRGSRRNRLEQCSGRAAIRIRG